MKNLNLNLYLVTDTNENQEEFLNIIGESIKGGVNLVQIREKTKDTLDFYKLALKVKKKKKKYGIPLIINDRVDIALAIDADGVHVGQSDMPCDITRKLIGDNKILGVSATTISEAMKAERDGADYIGTGAIFPTSTKKDAETVPKKELKEIVNCVNIPVVAIGGITIENAPTLLDTGIAGISVISAIINSNNPKESAEKLLNIFNS